MPEWVIPMSRANGMTACAQLNPSRTPRKSSKEFCETWTKELEGRLSAMQELHSGAMQAAVGVLFALVTLACAYFRDRGTCFGNGCAPVPKGKITCEVIKDYEWSCRDKSRILLTAEDGSKHCVKFGGKQ